MNSEFKRCLTPKPHKKTKFLNQLVVPEKIPPNKKIIFDSFIFADRVTNNRIVLGQAKQSFDSNLKKIKKAQVKNRQSKNQTIHTSLNKHKQIDQVNQCLGLMRTTKVFQKNTLKNKIFKNVEQVTKEVPQPCDEMMNLILKKKKLRQVFNTEVKNIIVKEFRKYFQGKKINPKVIYLTRHIPKKLNKHNIQKVVQNFIFPTVRQEKKLNTYDFKDIVLPQQKETISLLLDHVSLKMKQTQFLIRPEREKELFEKLYEHQNTKHEEFEYDFQEVQNAKFKEMEENMLVTKIKNENLKKKSKLDIKEKQIIFSIENGDILNFISLLIICPSLIHTKDQKDNNLLHIAAKLDQLQIFQLLLKKLGKQALSIKNKHGKTPIDLAQLFVSKKIIKSVTINQPYKL